MNGPRRVDPRRGQHVRCAQHVQHDGAIPSDVQWNDDLSGDPSGGAQYVPHGGVQCVQHVHSDGVRVRCVHDDGGSGQLHS